MLSDIRPLLTDEVRHVLPPERAVLGWDEQLGYKFGDVIPNRDMFGQLLPDAITTTTHAARVVYTPGSLTGPASHEKMADAKATIWLLNHPHPITIGDTFILPNDESLSAQRIERRTSGSDVLHKVYLT